MLDDDAATTFRDVITLALLALVTVLIIVIYHINEAASEDIDKPGSLIITVSWDDDTDADVDLWAQAPGEMPTGYSAKNHTTLNLLRDDLGFTNDTSHINAELIISRGMPDGEYTVNVHAYSGRNHPWPVTVYINVQMLVGQSMTSVFSKSVTLEYKGQEITVARFTVREGKLVLDSIHDLPKALRAQ